MNEWDTYAGRLLWAMRQAGKTNQSELARAIGVKPQSIQYLCDPQAGAQGSTHTPGLARELGVLADWLARGEGQPSGVEHIKVQTQSAGVAYAAVRADRAEVVGTFRLSAQGEVEFIHLPPGESDGHVCTPIVARRLRAVRVKGNALSPYVKDGQFLLLHEAGEVVDPEENVVITLKDGRVLIRELMYRRDDSLVLLPVHGGQPEAIEQADVASVDVIACVVPRRWWRPEEVDERR